MSVSKVVTIIKSTTARQSFHHHPEIKKLLWGGNLWTSGYCVNTVGLYGNKEVIRKYVEIQGKEKEYKKVHSKTTKFILIPRGLP